MATLLIKARKNNETLECVEGSLLYKMHVSQKKGTLITYSAEKTSNNQKKQWKIRDVSKAI